MGLLIFLPTAGFAHSGGTDKNGCHAGSQPYHCHGGGGGGGGGVTNPKPFVNPGPSAAERAELANAQAQVADAKASYAKSKPEAAKFGDRLQTAQDKLDGQREAIADLRTEVARNRENAQNTRATWIAEREDAHDRIQRIDAGNRASQERHADTVTGSIFVAGLFGGFLLLRVAKWIAALILGRWWMIATVLVGLFGSLLLLGASESFSSFALRIAAVALSGVSLSFILMFVRTWLTAAMIPPKSAVAGLGIATAVAVLAVAGAVTTAEPIAKQPTLADQAMVEEAQVDPAAEDLDEALLADATADRLEQDVDDLAAEIDDFDVKIKALVEQTEAAKSKAQTDEDAVVAAQEELDSLD